MKSRMSYFVLIVISMLLFSLLFQDIRMIYNEENSNSKIIRESIGLATSKFNFEWDRTWGGNNSDVFEGIVTDSLGNVYVGGNTDSFGAGKNDICIVKYDSLGAKLWNYTWGGNENDMFRNMIIDSLDNIYIVGVTDNMGVYINDIFALKYDSSGILRWNRTWGGNATENVRAIGIDSSNNLYIAGSTNSFGAGDFDFCLIKYDSSGNLEWNHTWGGNKTEDPGGIAIDLSNNIYIVGSTNSFGAGYEDFYLIKYDNLGFLKWNRTWGGSNTDKGSIIAIDSLGDIYLGGYTWSFGVGETDGCLVKYDNMGNYEWNRTWGGIQYERYEKIIIDSSDYIYLAGRTYVTPAIRSIILSKYDNAGTRLWSTIINLSDMDILTGMILDTASNICLTGEMTNPIDLKSDIFIIVYDSLGTQEHYDTWGGPQYDLAEAGITLDSSNNIYVAGATSSLESERPDACLIKYYHESITDGGIRIIPFGNYYIFFLIIGIISAAIIQHKILNKFNVGKI